MNLNLGLFKVGEPLHKGTIFQHLGTHDLFDVDSLLQTLAIYPSATSHASNKKSLYQNDQ